MLPGSVESRRSEKRAIESCSFTQPVQAIMLVRLFFLSPSGQSHLVFSRLYQSLLLKRLPGAIAPSWRRRSPDPRLRVHAQGQGREQEQEDGTFLTNLVVDLTAKLGRSFE